MCALLRLGIRFVPFVVAMLAGAGALVPPLAAQEPPAVQPASFLSRSPLVFDALHADPRWPHFSAAYQGWHGSEFDGVGAVSFGESFPFHRWRLDVDLIASWHATDRCRVYAGAGGIVHSKTDLDRWTVQGGVEYLAGTTWLGGHPVVAVDVQSREYTDWELDVSVRAGLQFQDEAMS